MLKLVGVALIALPLVIDCFGRGPEASAAPKAVDTTGRH